jgi:hypothetical protein
MFKLVGVIAHLGIVMHIFMPIWYWYGYAHGYLLGIANLILRHLLNLVLYFP